jgi:choline dehydrogenase-like flavoprotein
VVLSAGALATPQILQRSGVGNGTSLQRLGIKIISNLPGVGMNLRDHPYYRAQVVFVDVGVDDTGDYIVRANPETLASLLEDFEKNKGGPLSNNFVDAGMKLRPSDEQAKAFGPEFEEWWKADFADKPDKPIVSLQLFQLYLHSQSATNSVIGMAIQMHQRTRDFWQLQWHSYIRDQKDTYILPRQMIFTPLPNST